MSAIHHPLQGRPPRGGHLRHGALVVALLLTTAACGSDEGAATPDAAADGTTADGVTSDAGSDAGAADAVGADGSGSDATQTDATAADAANADATSTDTVAIDAGPSPKRPFVAHKLAIAGVWESAFGGNETLSDGAWVTPYGTAAVTTFDNDQRWLVSQNSKDDKYNPSAFNKVVWTAPKAATEGGFAVTSVYVCTVAFGLATADLAEQSTQTADDTDPAKSGCGSFPWTRLSALEVAGTWQTNFGSVEQINRQAWGLSWLRGFNNGNNVAYTQNPADAQFGPETFNKLVWTHTTAGKWFYCTVDYGLKSLDDAVKSAKSADDTEPAKSGCGGFSWTEMSAKP